MKKTCLILLCLLAMKAAFPQLGPRRTIYEDTALMKEVIDKITYSISNRGYYIPIYTRCDSVSEAKLTLLPTIYLLENYNKRNDISYNDFRELLSYSIREKKVMEDICPDDFEYLYGRDRVLARSVAFICDTLPQDFLEFIDTMDVDSLISWAFNSHLCYCRSFNLLPMVAQRLLLYGVLLHTGHDIEEIPYVDTYERIYYRYRQSVNRNSNKE